MKSYALSQVVLFLLVAFFVPALALAQTLPPPPPPSSSSTTVSIGAPTAPTVLWTGKRGALTGRVVSDDGQAFAGIGVSVLSLTSERSSRRLTTTDEEGNFKLNDLPAGAYTIIPVAPGYVNPDGSSSDGLSPSRATFYRLGESPTITMKKGGVITGKALDSVGQPLVAAYVSAYRVRDSEGRSAAGVSAVWRGLTDDRGIYRIFGLPSGSYLVATDGSGAVTSSAREVATYYPSATRDTAQEVAVATGSEVQGIDIRHHGELGRAVSGAVTGYQESRTIFGAGVTVELLQAATGVRVASASLSSTSGNSFVMYGVPDGEYEAIAYQQGFSSDANASRGVSTPRRVSVKGNDETGLELRIVGLGSIAGRVIVEKLEPSISCPIKQQGGREEALIMARRDEKESRPARFTWADGLPNEKGEFSLPGLVAGQYRLTSQLPGEHWYVKAITLPGAKTPAPQNAAPKTATINAANGVTVKGNEQVADLTITLAEGAAGLSGRLEGKKPPSRMRVHLVPAEKEAATEVLRYAEVVTRDGAFTFTHLAPGKYWLHARPVPDDESDEKPARTVAWDATARAKLRTEAEAANQSVALTPCQRLKDFVLPAGIAAK